MRADRGTAYGEALGLASKTGRAVVNLAPIATRNQPWYAGMNWPRLAGFILALALHGGAAYLVFTRPEAGALDEGRGRDGLTVVATVSLESGDLFTQEAREAVANSASAARTAEPSKEEEVAKPEAQEMPTPREEDRAAPVDHDLSAETKAAQDSKVTAIASAATEAQEAQQAAAAEAARRNKSWSLYQNEVYTALERHKTHVAQSGDVLIQITIAPSGALLVRHVVQSSGIGAVDEAAMRTLDRSAPFPPIPPELHEGPLTTTVPFRFRVR